MTQEKLPNNQNRDEDEDKDKDKDDKDKDKDIDKAEIEEKVSEAEETKVSEVEEIQRTVKKIPVKEEKEEGLSDLILPKGSKISIDELKVRLGSGRKIIAPVERAKLPEEIEKIWKEAVEEAKKREAVQLPTPAGVAKELEKPKLEKPKPLLKLKPRIPILKKEEVEEEYDVAKHGLLVDLEIPKDATYEEVELYPVNKPYAYIRIAYEPSTHEYIYQVLEPVLTEGEKELLNELVYRLIESIDINLKEIERKGAEKYLKSNIDKILRDYGIKLTPKSKEKITYYILRKFLGYDRIDPMMRDPNIEDISCDGPHTPIFIYHKKYESIKSNLIFEKEDELDSFIIKLAQICNRHISIAEPLLDATLPDGSRIQLTLGREVTTRGSTFTIRKFKEKPLSPPDLIDLHTFPTSAVAYLWLAVENSKSIIFAGGTASGKTTSLNAISLFIPPQLKIISIEDTRELNLPHPNWIPGVTREPVTVGGEGAIDMYELLRAALRQRPEFILLGEVRGKEAYVLFQAMATGHTTFSTMHADNVASVVHRLESPPINVPRIMLQALDIICVQVQVRVGGQRVRRCKSITEIVGVDTRTGELLTNEVFRWIPARDEFEYSGRSYILDKIMDDRGWTEEKMKQELRNRQEILEWMRLKGITHFEDVAKVVVGYYREPDKLMELVRKELYAKP
jgi:flagellar protein FlaI